MSQQQNIECQAKLCGAAMGYVDDDDVWHEFDGVEVSFMLPKEFGAQGISIGHAGRLTFIVEPSPSTDGGAA